MTAEKLQVHGARGGAFRHILVAFDGSSDAARALRLAVDLAVDLDGFVQVLLIVRPPPHVETAEQLAEAEAAERDNLSRGLTGGSSQAHGTWEVTTYVAFADDPAEAIAEHATEHGVDLVVMGGHGREQTTHGGIGHVLHRVLTDMPCPVLVV